MKNFYLLIIVFILTSCGDNKYYESMEPSDEEGRGISYLFVEQYPVVGLKYKCGDDEYDKTTDNGAFDYNKDDSCRFVLDNKELMIVKPKNLKDGRAYEITDENIIDKLYIADLRLDSGRIIISY